MFKKSEPKGWLGKHLPRIQHYSQYNTGKGNSEGPLCYSQNSWHNNLEAINSKQNPE